MKVEISENIQNFVKRKISDGTYSSAEEVVAAALNRWAVDEMEYKPGELDALLKPALEQIARGEGIPFDEAMRQLDEHKIHFRENRLGA